MKIQRLLIAGAIFLLAPMLARADDDPLYRGHTIVNKYDAAIAGGYADTLQEVLIKVSGDPRLADDARLKGPKDEANTYSTGVRYHDLWESIPIHDEQGTRDRPYDMWVTFDKAKIDALLKTLGRTPWSGTRPHVVAFIGLKDMLNRSFVLATDGPRGIDQRDALASAATTAGLTYSLPSTAILTGEKITYPRLAKGDLMPRVDTDAGNVALVGVLSASTNPPGWAVEWRLNWQGKTTIWKTHLPSFDAAFRNGLIGADQVFSGNGTPASE